MGKTYISSYNELDCLRGIAHKLGGNAGGANELGVLRTIVTQLDVVPGNRTVGSMNEVDCLRAIVRHYAAAGAAVDESIFQGSVPFATRQMGNWPNSVMSNGTDTGGMSRIAHVAKVAVSSVRFFYANNLTWGSGGTEAITIKASVEFPAGTFRPVSFGGSPSVTISPGVTALSDPVQVAISAAQIMFSRTYVTVSSGQWPKGIYTVVSTGEGAESSASPTDKTESGTVSNVADRTFAPALVVGTPVIAGPPVVLGIGDSILMGQADNGPAGDYRTVGWFTRAMTTNNIVSATLGSGGDRIQFFSAHTPIAPGDIRWNLVGPPFKTVICALGTNDVFVAASSFAAIQGYLQTFYNELNSLGIRAIQATITPQTTSSDGFATVENQTINGPKETVRTQLNDWIKTTPAPLGGFVDVSNTVESSANSGKWAVGNTVDGVHPTAGGHALMAAAVDAGVIALFL